MIQVTKRNRVSVIKRPPTDGVNGRLQYVWSPAYVDGLATRYTNGDGDYTDATDQQLYALADANWNVTALVQFDTGAVVERYTYDPYGNFQIWNAGLTALFTATQFGWDYYHQGGRYDARTGFETMMSCLR